MDKIKVRKGRLPSQSKVNRMESASVMTLKSDKEGVC